MGSAYKCHDRQKKEPGRGENEDLVQFEFIKSNQTLMSLMPGSLLPVCLNTVQFGGKFSGLVQSPVHKET